MDVSSSEVTADRTMADEYDVIVAGAGLAGHVAALTAAEAGATVCLLEKCDEYGGSSVRAGGGLVFVGTDRQREAGIDDSDDALRKDLTTAGGGVARAELIDAYVDNQLDTYEWMVARGVPFSLEQPTVPGGLARIHLTGRGVATRVLHDQVEADDRITYRDRAAIRRLNRGDGGRVDTVEVRLDGADHTVRARRSVILTTGGFARGRALLRDFAPLWLDAVPMGGAHNTGDGIVLAQALGAGLADMPYVSASFGASLLSGSDAVDEPILLYPNYRGAVIVNADGRRFANEEKNYKLLSRDTLEQPGGLAFTIFDEPIFQQSDDRAIPMDYKAAHASGLVRRATSIAELAEMLSIDADALQQTIDRYNRSVADGVDRDFGRPIKYRDNPGGGLIATAPFYGYPTRPGLTSTYAGVTVDASMQVRDVFGDAIPGLFAAGETVGGFHGAGYYSGTALGKAAVFGRIAGRIAGRDGGRP